MLNGGDANMCVKSGLNTQSLKMTPIRDPSMEGGCLTESKLIGQKTQSHSMGNTYKAIPALRWHCYNLQVTISFIIYKKHLY